MPRSEKQLLRCPERRSRRLPVARVAKADGKVAGRVDPDYLTGKAEAFLNKKYLGSGKKAPWLVPLKRSTAWVYFNHATSRNSTSNNRRRAHAGRLVPKQPGIERAFTRTEIMSPDDKIPSKLMTQMRHSFHPDCSGDVMVVLSRYHIFLGRRTFRTIPTRIRPIAPRMACRIRMTRTCRSW